MLPWLPSCLPVQKNLQKIRCFWTPFDRDILQSKKQAKIATGTGQYVNRLVPKNDIKSIPTIKGNRYSWFGLVLYVWFTHVKRSGPVTCMLMGLLWAFIERPRKIIGSK